MVHTRYNDTLTQLENRKIIFDTYADVEGY